VTKPAEVLLETACIKDKQFLEHALEAQLNISGKHSKEFCQLLGNLANSSFILGHLDKALQLYQELIEIETTITSYEPYCLHEDFHKFAVINTKMAHIYVELGHFDKAHQCYQLALQQETQYDSYEALNIRLFICRCFLLSENSLDDSLNIHDHESDVWNSCINQIEIQSEFSAMSLLHWNLNRSLVGSRNKNGHEIID
jgi:tetratricopeptide (TPR) repeat protein